MTATTFECPATERQKALLSKLTLSSAFTSQEAADTARWLNSPSATKAAASMLIERAFARIREKDARKKDAEARQEARRQAQQDAALKEIERTGMWTGTRATPVHGQIEESDPRDHRIIRTCPITGEGQTMADIRKLLFH